MGPGNVSEQESDSPPTPPPAKKRTTKKDKKSPKVDPKRKKGDESPRLSEDSD